VHALAVAAIVLVPWRRASAPAVSKET
jgi:hypothetical protein